MPPYSDPERQNLRERFPQQSRRRALVKISVHGLRMKISAGCIECAASSKASRCYECMPETQDVLCETLEQRDVLCFLKRTLRCRVGTTNAIYKDFAGAKPAWCDLEGKGG
jgi:hypothetical protein